MSAYVLSVAAEQDFDSVWSYISKDNLDAADRWAAKLFAAFDLIAQTPGMGHRREDLTALPVLFWPVGAYLIVYRVQSGMVEIVAVAQGARDLPSFLSQRVQ